MPVNANKPHLWKEDTARSIDLYNTWFLTFAPQTFRDTRLKWTEAVAETLQRTTYLTRIDPTTLRQYPQILSILRLATAPPLARDRLIGLANIPRSLVVQMEHARLPERMSEPALSADLQKIGDLITRLADTVICPWLEARRTPTNAEVERAAMVIADRVCGAASDPIIRNAQEQRQLAEIRTWLEGRGYRYQPPGMGLTVHTMQPGTFTFRLNVPVRQEQRSKLTNLPVDAAIMPRSGPAGTFPLLVEAKSAGDFANVNKRRKEEATKIAQLRLTYGPDVRFVLFLCGYFDAGYLGYEASEGIDWVWEHRIDDFVELGV